MDIPKLIKIRQSFGQNIKLENVYDKTREQIKNINAKICPGMKIAITAGSRGISNMPDIIRAVVDEVGEMGGDPFIIPAMGSHGGATAEGQKEILHSYGITEEYCGAPIKATMEVVNLPDDGIGHKVYMDRYAYEADGTVVVNRIKLHCDFHGPTESGLCKMCAIGLGKHEIEIRKKTAKDE